VTPDDAAFVAAMTAKAHESPHRSQFVVSESDIRRLCALARRPAGTCATCRYSLVEREDWGIVPCGIMGDKAFREAHPEIRGSWGSDHRPLFNPDGTRHGCSLHEPAPPQEPAPAPPETERQEPTI
jgi:hypothetical protein